MAKKRKYKNGGNVDDIFEYTTYLVTAETDNDSNPIYTGDDFESAKLEFDSANISEFSNDYGGMVLLRKLTNKYKFVGDLEDGYYEMSDFPIEDYYNDSDYYELIEEGDYEHIDSKDVKPINESSAELLNDVESYYKDIYGKWKYNKIVVDNGKNEYDDNYKDYGCIQLRIADHSENVKNIDKFGGCDYYISVVIANKDKTSGKFLTSIYERRSNEIELKFDSDNTFDEIINEIEENIEVGKDYILDRVKMKQGGTIKNNFEYTIGGL